MARQDVELQFRLIDGVTRGLAAIEQGVSGLGASITKVNQAVELTGRAFGALQAVGGAIAGVVNDVASVEDALARVNSITQATAEEQVALQRAVDEAVQTTRFSAQEAAGALVLLAEDGFSASDAVQQLGTVLAFAQANAQSAATAAQGLGAILDTFGEAPERIGSLADSLTAVARASGSSTQALQEGLARVGVAAEQAGVPVDQTVAALGALAQRGIEGGRAGQALATALQALTNPASAAGKALAELGLQGASFEQVLARLSTDSAAAEQVLSALGNRPRQAIRLLLTEGGADLRRFAGVIDESAGASQRAADALNKTFAGALARLTNQVQLARNELLAPLLAPLADEFEVLTQRIREFADSQQFDIIVEQVTAFAEKAIVALGDFIESFDFNAAVAAVQDFATKANESFTSITSTIQAFADVAASVLDIGTIAFEGLRSVVADAGAASLVVLAQFNEEAAATRASLQRIADEARNNTGAAVDSLVRRFDEGGRATAKFRAEVEGLGKGSKVTAEQVKDLALAMLPAPFRDVANAIEDVVRQQAELAQSGKETADAQDELNNALRASSIAAIEAQIAGLVRQQTELANAGRANSAEFRALTAEINAAEKQIAALREQSQGAAQAVQQTGESARSAAGGLREYASAAGSAAGAASQLGSSNSAVRDSFGNIARQSSETAVSLGNMTREYFLQISAAAGAAKSAGDYIRTLNSGIRAYEEENERIQQRIDLLKRQAAANDESAQVERALRAQYGNSSVLLEELIRLEQAAARSKRDLANANRELVESEEEVERTRKRVAGTLGGEQQAPPTPAPSGGGGGAGGLRGGGGDAPPVQITINGMPTTQQAWQELVQQQIAPALERLRRLSA